MFEGCQHLLSDVPPELALQASVIGSPDVGLVVDSVELQSDHDIPAEVEECLTETMYTLDLGPTDKNFAQEITVMTSTVAHHDLDGLDEETRAKIEQAMAGNGGDAAFRVIHVED
jgi:hypothetical protein